MKLLIFLPIEMDDIILYANWHDNSQLLKGDMDRNGVVDANDASIILELFKTDTVSIEDVELGDMDGNGLIDANDASLILDLYKTSN